MSRSLLALGALLALLAVAAGAFAAHGLRGHLPASAVVLIETAARYQMYHALGMLAAGLGVGRQAVLNRLPLNSGALQSLISLNWLWPVVDRAGAAV